MTVMLFYIHTQFLNAEILNSESIFWKHFYPLWTEQYFTNSHFELFSLPIVDLPSPEREKMDPKYYFSLLLLY